MLSSVATKPDRDTETRHALLDYGFRLFFLGAAAWALVDMAIWTVFYTFHRSAWLPWSFRSPMSWHAYEMIYGYAMAVVAGFLLTAVVNWTGRTTVKGIPLALLFLTWLLARVLPFQGGPAAFVVARCFDLVFLLSLAAVTITPCIHCGEKINSLLILVHLTFMVTGSLLYTLGTTSVVAGADRTGIYLGMYVLVLLTLVMGRRVIPFFIESAAAGRLELRNHPWVDRLAVPVVLIYVTCELFPPLQPGAPAAALPVAIVLGVRLAGWYTHFLWRRPLLWVLYVAYAWFLLGFILRAASLWLSLNPFLTIHAFTAGGIGTMTLGMMARVSLGHSGRNVQDPPRSVTAMFVLITASTALRAVVPLALPAHYVVSVAASQFLWIAAFLLFTIVYAPILTSQVIPKKGLLL